MRIYREPVAAACCVRDGGVLAYPTEGVFGLGCHWRDVTALQRILTLKQRPVSKGVILLVADEAMLAQVADLGHPGLEAWQAEAGTTWLLPPAADLPPAIRGDHPRVAVRIPAHPPALELVRATGPLVSTSANPATLPPARDTSEVKRYFPQGLDGLLDLPCGSAAGPSPIRDALSGERLR